MTVPVMSWTSVCARGALLVVLLVGSSAGRADDQARLPAIRPVAVPEWMFDGFLSVQTAEGSGLRRGYCTLETPQNIAQRLDPKVADRLEGQGVRFVIVHGVMGAGIKNEIEHVRRNKPLADALKAKGIRRVMYVQTIGNIFYEAFIAETPEAVNWLQRRPNGEPPFYYSQWFRQIPCINSDAFIEYEKNVIRTVMKELDLDGIFTDNYGYYSYSCRCPNCQKKFRAFLDRRYPTPESRAARFGTAASFDAVMPPPFYRLGDGSGHTGIGETHQMLDPVTQEWIRFRCERLGEVTREFNSVLKECNPDAVWFINYLYGGIPGLNNSLFHGSWPAFVYPHADLISAEVAGPPRWSSGVAQGRALIMKVAKHFGAPLSTCTFHGHLSGWKRLYLAEGFAFNTAPVDLSGDIFRDDPPKWMREYLQFYRDHRQLLAHAPTVRDCAVLHNFETLSYCCVHPQERLTLCEQSLLQGGITFDPIFDRDLEDLDQYRCIVLADVILMSRPMVEKFVDYVKRGGSLVITDLTAVLDEHMHPWKGEWLKPQRTRLFSEHFHAGWPQSGVKTFEFGKGRVAMVSQIDRPWDAKATRKYADQEQAPSPLSRVGHCYGPSTPMIRSAPRLALNHKELIQAVEYVLDGRRTIRIDAPPQVIPEVTRNDKAVLVHLVNWNEREPVKDVKVSLLAPSDRKIQRARLISPDAETSPVDIPLEEKEGRILFTVPSLVCYNVVVLE